jgi:Acetyltransferase (GNAT) domain
MTSIPKEISNGLLSVNASLDYSWDSFCEDADFPTAFMQTVFLNTTFPNAYRYFWIENSSIRAAIMLQGEEPNDGIPSFSVFHSISLLTKSSNQISEWGVADMSNFLQKLIIELTNRHQNFQLSLSPQFQDVRPFLWHNFEEGKDEFTILPRYTAIKNLQSFSCEIDLLNSMNKNRQRIYKKVNSVGLRFIESVDIQDFLDLYIETFARQDVSVYSETKNRVRSLLEIISGGKGMLLGAVDSHGKLLSGLAVVTSGKTACSLFIVNSSIGREIGASTWLIFKALIFTKELGFSFFDFVGSNTLGRGNFKLSFGSDLRLYFEARYRRE